MKIVPGVELRTIDMQPFSLLFVQVHENCVKPTLSSFITEVQYDPTLELKVSFLEHSITESIRAREGVHLGKTRFVSIGLRVDLFLPARVPFLPVQ